MRGTLLVVCFLLPLFLFSQQVAKRITHAGEQIGFYEYKPASYKNDRSTKYPVIIFLHGIGERGNGTSELWRVKRIAIPAYIDRGEPMRFYKNGKWHSFIVLSPQCPMKYGMWPTSYVDAMIEYAEKNLRIDRNRIYLTGLSMGGGGTWKFASASLKNAKKLAAIATVCAPSTLSNGCNIAGANLPMWSFHATNDNIVNVSVLTRSINKVLNCRPSVKPKKTIWNSGGHTIWDKAFDTKHRYQSPNVYEWFLGYSRNNNNSNNHQPPPQQGNKPPAAIAGPDKIINLPHNIAVLQGTRSVDKDGWIKSFKWTKISGPSCRIGNPNTGTTKVYGLTAGTYRFRLTVTDGKGAKSNDEVVVTVNRPPVVKTKGNKTIYLPANRVVLEAWATYDPDWGGYIKAFHWKKIGGPGSYKIESPTRASTRISNLKRGVYMFRVTATDRYGCTAFKDLTVTVKRAPHNASSSVLETQELSSTVDSVSSEQNSGLPAVTTTVFPNPAKSTVAVTCNTQLIGKSAITVFDISGRPVKTMLCDKNTPVLQRTIDVSMLHEGMYVISIVVNGMPAGSQKFVKQ
jgi:predicted esterase